MADDPDAPPQVDTSQPNPPPATPTVMPQGPASPPLGQENLGIPSSIQQKATQSARPGVPIVWQLISDMRNAGQPGHPGTRLEGFESFLGNFINALGQGFANEGHGPGAWARGAGAALTAPLNREVAAQQFGSQQAEAAQQQQLQAAQTQETQQRAALTGQQAQVAGMRIPMMGPDGNPIMVNGQPIMIPATQGLQYSGQMMRGVGAAQVAGQARLGVAELQAQTLAGKAAKYIPDVGPDGQRFYHVMNPQGKEIGQTEVNAIPSLMQRTSNTVEWKDDGKGGFEALPKTTTSGPNIPGRTPAAQPAGGASKVTGQVSMPSGNSPKYPAPSAEKWMTWTEPGTGRMVAGPAATGRQQGATDMAQLNGQEVRDVTNARHAVNLMTKVGDPNKPETQGVLQLINGLDADGKLGVLASRWNSFMTTGVGHQPGDDPRIITLIDKNMLGDTATMLAHFGASGGRSPQMLQHFLDLANSRKMDGPTLKAGVMAMTDYMKDRSMTPSSTTPQTGGGGKEIHYKIVNGQLVPQ